jgi:hypothetical protein
MICNEVRTLVDGLAVLEIRMLGIVLGELEETEPGSGRSGCAAWIRTKCQLRFFKSVDYSAGILQRVTLLCGDVTDIRLD